MYRRIHALNPRAPVEAFAGHWIHTTEYRAAGLLPYALAQFRLLPARYNHRPHALNYSRRGTWTAAPDQTKLS